MRVRNPQTGTVLQLDTETANAYITAGWESADEKPKRSTSEASTDDTKTRRRRTASK